MAPSAELSRNSAATVVLVNRDGMGSADEVLRRRLLRVYRTLLLDNGLFRGAICFYAEGVKLVVQDSPVLDLLAGSRRRAFTSSSAARVSSTSA